MGTDIKYAEDPELDAKVKKTLAELRAKDADELTGVEIQFLAKARRLEIQALGEMPASPYNVGTVRGAATNQQHIGSAIPKKDLFEDLEPAIDSGAEPDILQSSHTNAEKPERISSDDGKDTETARPEADMGNAGAIASVGKAPKAKSVPAIHITQPNADSADDGDAASEGAEPKNDPASDKDIEAQRVATKLTTIVKNAFCEPLFIASVIILLILILFVRPFYVPSGSMIPTLEIGDRMFTVARYFPNGNTYERGDIVCFKSDSGDTLVKRVIGKGGDLIQISGNDVYVNGEKSPWQGTGGTSMSITVQLGENEYWMMGDNRGNSRDSRVFGAVPADRMISKVYGIYLPFDRMQLFL